MALIVPDTVPSKASAGEKKLYRILHYELPDDCYVWYEPRIEGVHPDFIVLSPTMGLLILEVKGWHANQIVGGNSQFFDIQHGDRAERQQSPLRQVKLYVDNCLGKLKQYPVLLQEDGDYQGQLAFPVGCGVIMSNITTDQARAENIYPLLEQPQVAYRDELMSWEGIGERALVKRLEEMFVARFDFMALTDDQIATIRGVLYPEKTIRSKPATPASVPGDREPPPDSSVLVTLDLEQERLAADIRDGHRLFCGVAGSGKTIILLSRAKHLASRLFVQRVLVLCFNITLASYLQSLIRQANNELYNERIVVTHFHGWARSVLWRLPNPQYVKEDYDRVLGERLLEAIHQLPQEQKWDAVLVDEAHTFAPEWFRCCVEALKDPENGDLLIVSDANQRLYARREFTWKSVGIKAQGRTKKLSRNYRNTQEILSAAWQVAPAKESDGDEDDVTFPVVEPSAALRHGTAPVLHLTTSRAQIVEALLFQIQQCCDIGYSPKDIAIIYRYRSQMDAPLFDRLRQQLESRGWGCYWVTENKQSRESYNPDRQGVRLLTALSALGLEFRVVMIPWVQQFGDRYSQQGEAAILARRQLYVAMTRAQEELHLFGSRGTPQGKRISNAIDK